MSESNTGIAHGLSATSDADFEKRGSARTGVRDIFDKIHRPIRLLPPHHDRKQECSNRSAHDIPGHFQTMKRPSHGFGCVTSGQHMTHGLLLDEREFPNLVADAGRFNMKDVDAEGDRKTVL